MGRDTLDIFTLGMGPDGRPITQISNNLVSPGVYVVMHNHVLQFPGVTKDLDTMTFVKKS